MPESKPVSEPALVPSSSPSTSQAVAIAQQLIQLDSAQLQGLLGFVQNFSGVRDYLEVGHVTTFFVLGEFIQVKKTQDSFDVSPATIDGESGLQ